MRSLSIRSIIVTLALLFLLPVSSRAVFLADIDQDGDINLKDAILSLQIVSGKSPAIPQMAAGTDLDKDGKIGLAETLYTLRAVGQSTSALSHRAAVTGPLSGVAVAASRAATGEVLEGIKKANSSLTDLQVAGSFDLSLPGADDTEWVVVAVTGGMDIDADGNGVIDPTPTANQGTLHTLARAGDWRSKQLRITPLTELAWRYVEQLIDEVPPEDVAIRLEDTARNLIKADIDSSGSIDWYDILAFDPANAVHREKLATSYDWLSTVDAAGHSILGTLLAGNEAQMLARMDEIYSYLMTRLPVPDSRYHSTKVALAVFGPGSASSSAPYALSVDSTLAEPIYADHLYATQNESALVTFTATPGQNARILSWNGCDTVSADLSQCTVPLNRSQSVIVNFGRTETQLTGIVHDFRRTLNIVGVDTVTVAIPEDMADMIAEMASAAVGDFVVGPNGGGFLRRITGITQLSSTSFKLDTVEAGLDEVIAQGTGYIFRQMENGDLEGYVSPPQASQSATVAPKAFTGLEGVRLVPSTDPRDKTFKLVLGTPKADTTLKSAESLTQEVVLYEDSNGNTLTASGEINVDISVDFAVDYKPIRQLDYFKWIAILDAEERVELTASANLADFDLAQVKIGTFRFSPIVFAIGAVPVWVSPIVDIFFFADGSVEGQVSFGVEFNQKAEGGLLYNKNTGWSLHKAFSSDHSPIPPSTRISASVRGGIEMRPVLKIYDATGPALPQKLYAKMEASYSREMTSNCSDIVLSNFYGFETFFIWDLSGSTKLGQMLHLDQLEENTHFTIVSLEELIDSTTLYDNCPEYVRGSHLQLQGDGIYAAIDAGYADGLVTTLKVVNTGDEVLNWNTSFVPSEVLVSPSHGSITPGGEQIVQMSVATSGLSAGHYLKKVFFYNETSVGQSLADEKFGNTWKTIDINVRGPVTDSPVITTATSPAVGQVALDWTFTPSGNTPFVGFQIYATTTPENLQSYQLIQTTDIYSRNILLSGFVPGKAYSLDMRAFSNTGSGTGPFSNKASVTVTGTTLPYLPSPINDTGITWGGNYPSGNNTSCTSNIAGAQDCSQGRDATDNNDADGHAGFSYTRLDINGNSLSAGATNWSCVRDNVTGLVWEVKTDDGTIHDKDNTYRWGGKTALGSGYGIYYSDWNSLVDGSNGANFCGYSDWRVPTHEELEGLVDYGRNNPAIDTAYFPDTPASNFWSASPVSGSSNDAWLVYFYNGNANDYGRNGSLLVRLVRSGQ